MNNILQTLSLKIIINSLDSHLLSGAWRTCPGLGKVRQPRQRCCIPPFFPLSSHPPRTRQKGWEGEHSSAFIFGASSLKIPRLSCLMTLPFDLNELRGPAGRPTLCSLSFKGEGRGDRFLRPLKGHMWGRGRTDVRAALSRLQPPAQQWPPKGRGEPRAGIGWPSASARTDWLARF